MYDGHGGTQSALYTQEHLHSKLTAQPAFKTGDYKEALIKAFLDLDKEMVEGKHATKFINPVKLIFNRIFIGQLQLFPWKYF